MQIGIIGKGCIGKCLAHSLKQSAIHHPSFLVKSTTFKSLKSEGIIDSNQCNVTYHPFDNNESIETSKIPIFPMENDNCNPAFDAIVIPTKSFQLIPALQQLETNNFLQNRPTIILFHNGIISPSDIPSFVQSKDIALIFGTTVHAVTSFIDDDPFTVRHTGHGLTWLGFRDPFGNTTTDQTILCDIFNAAFNPTTWFEDIEPHLLYKLAINCCINPLTAIYQIRNDGLIGNEKYQSEMRKICTELCDVFRACYDDLKDKNMEKHMDKNSVITWDKLCNFHVLWDAVLKVLENVKLNYSSMNRDIYFNRQSEIEQINGYIVELGKKYNVDVQYNQEIVDLIREVESRYLLN